MVPIRTCKETSGTYLVQYSTKMNKEGHKRFNEGNTAEFEQKEYHLERHCYSS
jgi:hypothetical protein